MLFFPYLANPLRLAKSYWDGRPHRENGAATDGGVEHHWTISGLLNPLADAGLVLIQIAESPARDPQFWEGHSYEPGTDSAS